MQYKTKTKIKQKRAISIYKKTTANKCRILAVQQQSRKNIIFDKNTKKENIVKFRKLQVLKSTKQCFEIFFF